MSTTKSNPKKKDLELVCSLRWRNGSKDKRVISIVAVYDIPATTLNFQIFKSYLLKNSGTTEDDVIVYYIMDSGKEYLIESATDFQVALYSFRRKARAGELIHLLLERVSDRQNSKQSADVQTQSDNIECNASSTITISGIEMPPDWFVAGLAQLKQDISQEMTTQVSNLIANAVTDIKTHFVCAHSVRHKPKPEKRLKKYLSHAAQETVSDAKDFIKSLKLENKLEKLERKASKYREKRLKLQHSQKSSDSEAGLSGKCSYTKVEEPNDVEPTEETEPLMDARPVNEQNVIPHMMGGEYYTHQWEIKNTGKAPWTTNTRLEYTWGSKKLQNFENNIQVPLLKPGETGTIYARFRIPNQKGKYESYWQFTHNHRRFGHWLGVQVIVDNYGSEEKGKDIEHELSEEFEGWKINNEEERAVFSKPFDASPKLNTAGSDETEYDSDCSCNSELARYDIKSDENNEFVVVPVPSCFTLAPPVDVKLDEESAKGHLSPAVAVAGENPHKTMEPPKQVIPAENHFDTNNNAESARASSSGSIKLRDEELDNIVVITVPKDEQVREGFIYVHVDGQKVLIPKNILKDKVLNAAQEAESIPSGNTSIGVVVDELESLTPKASLNHELHSEAKSGLENVGNTLDSALPKNLEQPIQPQSPRQDNTHTLVNLFGLSSGPVEDSFERSNYCDAENYLSHCSAAGSCHSEVNCIANRQTRMFIFPQDVPGYEVFTQSLETNQTPKPESQPHELAAVPNYQQTPLDMRRTMPPKETVVQGELEERAKNLKMIAQFVENAEAAPVTAPSFTPPVAATTSAPQVHLLPESLVNGAVNVASSAINTARSVINMIKPQPPGQWVNGHWVSNNPQTPREANLEVLAEMGFWNRDLNATLLARFNDDVNRVIAELVQ